MSNDSRKESYAEYLKREQIDPPKGHFQVNAEVQLEMRCYSTPERESYVQFLKRTGQFKF